MKQSLQERCWRLLKDESSAGFSARYVSDKLTHFPINRDTTDCVLFLTGTIDNSRTVTINIDERIFFGQWITEIALMYLKIFNKNIHECSDQIMIPKRCFGSFTIVYDNGTSFLHVCIHTNRNVSPHIARVNYKLPIPRIISVLVLLFNVVQRRSDAGKLRALLLCDFCSSIAYTRERSHWLTEMAQHTDDKIEVPARVCVSLGTTAITLKIVRA